MLRANRDAIAELSMGEDDMDGASIELFLAAAYASPVSTKVLALSKMNLIFVFCKVEFTLFAA